MYLTQQVLVSAHHNQQNLTPSLCPQSDDCTLAYSSIFSPALFHRPQIRAKSQKRSQSRPPIAKQSLAKFEQSLTDVGRNRAIAAAKHFFERAKSQVSDRANSPVVKQVFERTERIRQKASQKVVDPLAKAFKTDPEQRKKILQVKREALRREKPKNPMDSLGSLFSNAKQSKQHKTPNSSVPKEDTKTLSLVPIPQPPAFTERTFSDSQLVKSCSSLASRFGQSNSIFTFFFRSIWDSISERFAHVFFCVRLKLHRQLSYFVQFSLEAFVNGELREEIIPRVMHAFLNGELAVLKNCTSESTFNVLKANLEAMKPRPGPVLEGEIFDLRDVT